MTGFATETPPQVPQGPQASATQEAAPAGGTIPRGMWWLIGTFVGGLAIAAALVVISTKGSSSTVIRAQTPAQTQQLLQGIPQHGAILGNPSAPLKITEFADLQCPFCGNYTLALFPELVRNYVRTGKAYMVLEWSTSIGPQSVTAAQAAVAAGEQNKMWNFADVFYNHQGTENTGYVTDKFLTDVAGAVPGLDVARVMADRTEPNVASVLSSDHQQYEQTGAKGTPTFLLQRAGHPTVKLVGAEKIISEVAALAK